MSLSELVSKLTPGVFAEVALVIFLVTFTAVLVSVLRRSNRSRFEAAGRMPLDDDQPRAEDVR